jgi:hypothetical protein
MAIQKFKVQLVYDINEKKLVSLGNVHDKNGVIIKSVIALPMADPDQPFPTVLIQFPQHKVVHAEIIVEVPEAPKKGEITLRKDKKKR